MSENLTKQNARTTIVGTPALLAGLAHYIKGHKLLFINQIQ